MASPATRTDLVLGTWSASSSLLCFSPWWCSCSPSGCWGQATAEPGRGAGVPAAGGAWVAEPGILASTWARNEFQVVQFIPLFVLPQVFLGACSGPWSRCPGI